MTRSSLGVPELLGAGATRTCPSVVTWSSRLEGRLACQSQKLGADNELKGESYRERSTGRSSAERRGTELERERVVLGRVREPIPGSRVC